MAAGCGHGMCWLLRGTSAPAPVACNATTAANAAAIPTSTARLLRSLGVLGLGRSFKALSSSRTDFESKSDGTACEYSEMLAFRRPRTVHCAGTGIRIEMRLLLGGAHGAQYAPHNRPAVFHRREGQHARNCDGRQNLRTDASHSGHHAAEREQQARGIGGHIGQVQRILDGHLAQRNRVVRLAFVDIEPEIGEQRQRPVIQDCRNGAEFRCGTQDQRFGDMVIAQECVQRIGSRVQCGQIEWQLIGGGEKDASAFENAAVFSSPAGVQLSSASTSWFARWASSAGTGIRSGSSRSGLVKAAHPERARDAVASRARRGDRGGPGPRRSERQALPVQGLEARAVADGPGPDQIGHRLGIVHPDPEVPLG